METTANINDENDESNEYPFRQTENGLYTVPQPNEGNPPNVLTIQRDGVQYVLSGLQGTLSESRCFPNVLAYEFCERTEMTG